MRLEQAVLTLRLFKFGFDELVAIATAAGFERFECKKTGLRYLLLASKRKG